MYAQQLRHVEVEHPLYFRVDCSDVDAAEPFHGSIELLSRESAIQVREIIVLRFDVFFFFAATTC